MIFTIGKMYHMKYDINNTQKKINATHDTHYKHSKMTIRHNINNDNDVLCMRYL